MSLVAWYPLHKDFKDWSGNKLHLVNENDLTKISDGGLFGKGGHFPNNPACRVHYDDFPIPEGDISVSAWFKVNGDHDVARGMIFSLGRDYIENGGPDFGLSFSIGSKRELYVNYNTNCFTIIPNIQYGVWYNLTFIRGCNNNLKIYLNNELMLEKEVFKSEYYYRNLYIGKMSYNGHSITNYFPFNGFINDVRVYNHILSSKERKDIYDAKMIHYKFNDPYEIPTKNLHEINKTYINPSDMKYDILGNHNIVFKKKIEDIGTAGFYIIMKE